MTHLLSRHSLASLTIYVAITWGSAALAESPAPTVHWGGLAYPDQTNTLSIGFTGNRFTEFDGSMHRYNSIRESMGFNFGSLSWTQHWDQIPGLSTNITVGAGPTGEQPTRYLQNEFVHYALLGIPKVSVDKTRSGFDGMVDASATYWHEGFGSPRVFFLGGGISAGSLYTEGFVRAGMRRMPIGPMTFDALGLADLHCNFMRLELCKLFELIKGLRLSGMGRVGGLANGSVFPDDTVSSRSYLAQASISWGIYDEAGGDPFFEIEGGYTIDSGLFARANRTMQDEKFWSLGFRIRNFSFETWNDQANNKDNGPTYGLRLTYNLYPHLFGKS